MNTKLRRFFSLLLVSTMLTGCNVNESTPGNVDTAIQYSISEKKLPLYVDDIKSSEDLRVYFVNETGVPYISIYGK